ncbi:MAG: glycosyltransferase [Frondihabitans sp.]|nr:glycosyltransferase [Frondihabitans sp.]
MSVDGFDRMYFVVPEGIDDHRQVSGGNVYDRHLRDGLRELGWDVAMISVAEPRRRETERALIRIPDGAVVLVDGLVGVQAPDALTDHAPRLRLVVLAHMVASRVRDDDKMSIAGRGIDDREHTALAAASRIITTSNWTRNELIARGIDPHLLVVAPPGTVPAPASIGSTTGGRLLCVGAVAHHKGQDLLIRALSGLSDLHGWTCALVGSRTVAPDFVDEMTELAAASGLADRIAFTGILTGTPLENEFARADLVVAPSRVESYGMAAAEALAHGVPVLATRVGGLPEAISYAQAGILVPPDDVDALAVELRRWLLDPTRRSSFRSGARDAREHTRSWSVASRIVAEALLDLERVA